MYFKSTVNIFHQFFYHFAIIVVIVAKRYNFCVCLITIILINFGAYFCTFVAISSLLLALLGRF